MPHGGELSGPASVRACLDELHADRIGHGVAAATAALLERVAAARVTLEVCPSSNVALGVAATPADVPLRPLLDAGIGVALGADDPLLFGRRLNAQYETRTEVHGLSDGELAELARMSVRGSAAPAEIRTGCSPVSTPGCRPPRPPDRRNAAQRRPGLSLTMAGAGTAARPEPPGHHGSAPR